MVPNGVGTVIAAMVSVLPAAAQTTWIVDMNNGPGTSFVTLIGALASPLVQPGDDHPFAL